MCGSGTEGNALSSETHEGAPSVVSSSFTMSSRLPMAGRRRPRIFNFGAGPTTRTRQRSTSGRCSCEKRSVPTTRSGSGTNPLTSRAMLEQRRSGGAPVRILIVLRRLEPETMRASGPPESTRDLRWGEKIILAAAAPGILAAAVLSLVLLCQIRRGRSRCARIIHLRYSGFDANNSAVNISRTRPRTTGNVSGEPERR